MRFPPSLIAVVLVTAWPAFADGASGLEVGLFPADVSLTRPRPSPSSAFNPARVMGTSASLLYQFAGRIGVRALGGASWFTSPAESSPTVPTPGGPLPTWWAFGGLQLRFLPTDGDWLAVLLNVDGGVLDSKVALDHTGSDVTWGPTGLQAAGLAGASAQLRLERHVALRVEARLSIFGSSPARVWGCNTNDLSAMEDALRKNEAVSSAAVSAGCNTAPYSERTHLVPAAEGELAEARYFLSGALTLTVGLVVL